MHRIVKYPLALLGLLLALCVLAACSGSGASKSGSKIDSKTNANNYNKLVAQDPAHSMNVSQTRKNINRWIDTWGKDPNKLAYVYLQNGSGDLTGYFVFKGLPVSYCTALTPTQHVRTDSSGGNLVVQSPSIDGVYYSGGECNTYYGFDANTGAYIEYTIGTTQNVLIYDQPLAQHPNVENLAPKK